MTMALGVLLASCSVAGCGADPCSVATEQVAACLGLPPPSATAATPACSGWLLCISECNAAAECDVVKCNAAGSCPAASASGGDELGARAASLKACEQACAGR